jgi:hypothetical protein
VIGTPKLNRYLSPNSSLRRTVIWFALAVFSVASLTYRVHEFQRSCRAYVAAHQHKTSSSEPLQPKPDPNETVLVAFDPCSYEDPSPIDERIVALIAVVSVPVSLGWMIRDLLRWRRRKPAETRD